MARTNQHGLELTFHKNSKRWCKVINGKRKYFGSGKGVSDRASYRAALTRYRDFMDREYQQEMIAAAAQKTLSTVQRLERERELAGLLSHTDESVDLVHRTRLAQLKKAATTGEAQVLLAGRSISEFLAGAKPRSQRRKKPSDASDEIGTIASTIDRYLAARESDAKLEGTNLSLRGYKSLQNGVKTFKNFAGVERWGEPQENEKILARYRLHLEDRLRDRSYTAHTFNDKCKHLKPYLKWLYRERLIVEIPRNMDTACRKVASKEGGKPLSKDEIVALWEHADVRMRCWIALGLNCGFYSKDISDLVPSHIEAVPGYVARWREKQKTAMSKHLLWPLTQRLIDEVRYKGDDSASQRLFLSEHGTLLNTEERDLIGVQFARTRKAANVTATFSQIRDTGVDFIENQYGRQMKPYDPSLKQLCLSHKDSSTARFYLSDDPAKMELPALDEALRKMDAYFGLKHDASGV